MSVESGASRAARGGGAGAAGSADGKRPALDVERILRFSDAHRTATGRWPTSWSSGPVRDAHGETWPSVDIALREGRRGLPGGSSLAQLLAEQRRAPNIYTEPPLTAEQILAWADAHRAATGRWPTLTSGPVAGAPGEKWVNLEAALRLGRRGLPRGTNITRLIAEHRGTADPPAAATRSRGGPDAPAAGGAASRA